MKKCLLIYLCAGILFTMTSCLKKQDLSDDNLGPAVEPVEVTKTLGSGIGSYDYNLIKPNEFTSVLVSQRIQDSVTQNIEQQGITVVESANTVDSLKLKLNVQKEEYSGGQTSQSSRQWDITLNKGAAKTEAMSVKPLSDGDSEPPILLFLNFETIAFGFCHDSGEYPETCHNLKSENIQFRAPIAAAAQHGCADTANCFIPAKKIEFDRLQKTVLDKDGKPKRTHYTMIISPETPFLSRMMQLCIRGVYGITNSDQKILADVCYTVNNYAFGQ